MTPDEQHESQQLFPDFRPATLAAWQQKATKDLRNTPLDSLTWQTYEGIAVKPYYAREDVEHLPLLTQQPGIFPFARGRDTSSNNWLNVPQITVGNDSKSAINQAADALQRGADGVHFILQDASAFEISYLIKSIDLSQYNICYTLQQNPHIFLERLYQQLKASGVPHQNLRGYLNYDPLTSTGTLSEEEASMLAQVLEITQDSPDFYGVVVNGTNFSRMGASTTQEIAYTLSAAVTYLDKLTTAGENPEAALRNVQFYMASGTNYFFEIAKLRALRLLWAAITDAYQASPDTAGFLRIHSVTSSWYQTTLDPYVNMLRVTTEAMAALIAGCDALTVVPFDSTYKSSGEFSARIARNVSVILKEEAYLDKAIDPAAGSYYLEWLTNELATKAWDLFKDLEAQGGFESAYTSGRILDSITEVSYQKFKNIAAGRDVLVGTNKYPNPKESLDFDPEALMQHAAFDTARAAYPTEVMRMATELHLRKRKRRPKVILAVIGTTEKRHLHAVFAQEFFNCAGFDTQLQHYTSAAEAADQLLNVTAEVIVVSASETAFQQEFGPLLRDHTYKPVVMLADDPQHMKEEMIASGYNEFIFEGCDMSSILVSVHKKLSQEETQDI